MSKKHSQYWAGLFGNSLGNLAADQTNKDISSEQALKLVALKRGISNFVTILTGKTYPVMFATQKTSFTDGNVVVVSADTENMDEVVGLALHEASHLLLSNFQFLHLLDRAIPKETLDKATKLGYTPEEVRSQIKWLWNTIEDRRIDLFVYKNAPGYRPYYEAMYHANADALGEETTQAIKDKKFSEKMFMHYNFNILFSINPEWDASVLPKLDEMVKTIDFDTIDRHNGEKYRPIISKMIRSQEIKDEDMPGLWRLVLNTYNKILDNVDPALVQKDKQMLQAMNGQLSLDQLKALGLTKEQLEMLKKFFKFVNGNASKKEISDKTAELLKMMEASGVKLEYAEFDPNQTSANNDSKQGKGGRDGKHGRIEKVPVTVYTKYDASVLNSDSFPFASSGHGELSQAVQRGMALGNMLAARIMVRNMERPTEYPRKRQGQIDKRMLAEAGFERESIFTQRVIDSYEPIHVHITVDASGSMAGQKFEDAMITAIAIATAADKINNLDVSISLRSTARSGEASVAYVYDSRKDNISKIRSLFSHLHVAGGTPEGLTFEVLTKYLSIQPHTRQYFVNLSDGLPAHGWHNLSYGGLPAAYHTRQQVNKIREMGYTVMSYFIGNDGGAKEQFNIMYGKDARYVNATEVTSLVKTMNQMFLDKGSGNEGLE